MRVFGVGYLVAFVLDHGLMLAALWSDAADAVSDWTSVLVAFATLAVLVLALFRKLTPWVPYALVAGFYFLLITVLMIALAVAMAMHGDPDGIPDDATTRVLAERIPWVRPMIVIDAVLNALAGAAALAVVSRRKEAAPAVA